MRPGNVLLIGGNGFLGTYTAEAFTGIADSVHVLDTAHSMSSGHPNANLPQYKGSVSDIASVRRAVERSNADTIVVLASFGTSGMGLVKSAEANPEAALQVNVNGLLNVLETATKKTSCRVLWMSSTTVYGDVESYNGVLVSEEDLLYPQSIYAATKVLGEQLIRSFRDQHGLEATSIRPSLIWGPGIRYRGVQSALNDMVEAAARGDSVSVQGSNEPLDLLYIRDAAMAPVWLSMLDELPPIVLANGYQASMDEVRTAVLDEVPAITLTRQGNFPHLRFPNIDDSLARGIGYLPQFDLPGSIKDFLATVKGETNAPTSN